MITCAVFVTALDQFLNVWSVFVDFSTGVVLDIRVNFSGTRSKTPKAAFHHFRKRDLL